MGTQHALCTQALCSGSAAAQGQRLKEPVMHVNFRLFQTYSFVV